ncbi:unnamed protein product [Ixodes pacificus]
MTSKNVPNTQEVANVLSERQLVLEQVEIEEERARQHDKHLKDLRLQITLYEEKIQGLDENIERGKATLNTSELYLKSLTKSFFSLQQQERDLQEKLALQEQKSAARLKQLSEDEANLKSLLSTIKRVEKDLKDSQGITKLEESVKELAEKYASKEAYLLSLKEQIYRRKEDKRRAATQPFVKLATLYKNSEAAKQSIKCLNDKIRQLQLKIKDLKIRQDKSNQKKAAGKEPFKLLPITYAPSQMTAPSPTRQPTHSIYFDKQSRQTSTTTPAETSQVQDSTAPKPVPCSPRFAKPTLSTPAALDKTPIHKALELLESPSRQSISQASSTYLDDLKTLMSTTRPGFTKRSMEPDPQNSEVVPPKQPRNRQEWLLPGPRTIGEPKSGIQLPSLPRTSVAAAVRPSNQNQDLRMTKSPKSSYKYAKEPNGQYQKYSKEQTDQYQDLQTAKTSGPSYRHAERLTGEYEDSKTTESPGRKGQSVPEGFAVPNVQKENCTTSQSFDSGSQAQPLSSTPPGMLAEREFHSGSTKLSDVDSDILKFDTISEVRHEAFDVFGEDSGDVQGETSGFQLAPKGYRQGQPKFLF